MKTESAIREMGASEMYDVNGGAIPILAAVFLKGFAAGSAIGLALLPNIIEKRDEK